MLVSAGVVQVVGAGLHLSLSGNLRVYNHGTFKTASQILGSDQCAAGVSSCYDVMVTAGGTMVISAGGRVDVSLAIFNATSISVGDGAVVSCTARGYPSTNAGMSHPIHTISTLSTHSTHHQHILYFHD